MSENAAGASQRNAQPRGVIAAVLTLPLKLFGVLCGSLLLAILIECAGMHWFWPQEGWHHAECMLTFELAQLSSEFPRSALLEDPARAAQRFVSGAFDALFVQSGLLENAAALTERARAGVPRAEGFRRYLTVLCQHLEDYARAAGYTVLTCLTRLLVLCLALPLFVLSAFVGFVDGIVRRDVRRFGAGHESGFVHHRARAAIVPLIALPWVIYLAMPVSVHPLLILLPSAALLGLAVNLTAASFKKYL